MNRNLGNSGRRLELKAQLARQGLHYRDLVDILRERGLVVGENDVAQIVAGRRDPPIELKNEIATILGRPSFEIFK